MTLKPGMLLKINKHSSAPMLQTLKFKALKISKATITTEGSAMLIEHLLAQLFR